MRGINTLRVALGTVQHSMVPLVAASFSYQKRNPGNLDGLELLLIEHLADTEDALAHVRRMKIAQRAV